MKSKEAHQLMVRYLASPAHARACELIAKENSQTAGSGKPLNPVLVDWNKACRKGGMTWAK
jgi:hypothetical protein